MARFNDFVKVNGRDQKDIQIRISHRVSHKVVSTEDHAQKTSFDETLIPSELTVEKH